jgi:dihydroneopterin aldolase
MQLFGYHKVHRQSLPQVHCSNGHFYDVVHGISLWNGVSSQDVYFDVTAEVNGRNSGMAAADAVASSLSEIR